MSKARASAFVRVVEPVLWVIAVSAAAAMGVEILLQYRTAIKDAYRPVSRPGPRLDALNRAYAPFVIQHLHPQYLFFFPLEPQERVALGNRICSLDADGFREPGPAAAGGRKLAFLLGGSAAFGHSASSNATTITSYLNGLQDEFFFVNAGVPSWNSTQELFRLTLQIAELRPALIVTYDGANDSALAGAANPRRPSRYPPGTPDNFVRLDDLFDDIGAGVKASRIQLFPELRHRLEKYRGSPSIPAVGASPADIVLAARHYSGNQARMAAIARGSGARFVSVFQPIASLHGHIDPAFGDRDETIAAFHDAVVGAAPPAYEFHDLASVFDHYFDSIPVAGYDVADETVFVDGVHVHDRGNEIVARHLLQLMRLDQPPPLARAVR